MVTGSEPDFNLVKKKIPVKIIKFAQISASPDGVYGLDYNGYLWRQRTSDGQWRKINPVVQIVNGEELLVK